MVEFYFSPDGWVTAFRPRENRQLVSWTYGFGWTWLVLTGTWLDYFSIYWGESSQLTFIFFRGVGWNHQPDTWFWTPKIALWPNNHDDKLTGIWGAGYAANPKSPAEMQRCGSRSKWLSPSINFWAVRDLCRLGLLNFRQMIGEAQKDMGDWQFMVM